MDHNEQQTTKSNQVDRLMDEVKQLHSALKASSDEVARLAEDRDRLLRHIAAQAREMQAINAAYKRRDTLPADAASAASEPGMDRNEPRVAFAEMQVLTEELEVANNSLLETNRALDRRVEERTRELERKNRALTESEQRFRTLVEGIPQLVWRAEGSGQWTWASPQWVQYTGLSIAQSSRDRWLNAVHPDDREVAKQAWAETAGGAPLDMSVRLYHWIEDRYRHFRIRASPVERGDGQPVEWLGTATDVDDTRQLQARQQLLLAELQHRVRNILTVVRSVFGRTIEAGGDLEDIADHFRGRLDSLARTQVIVTRTPSGHVDLEDLIRGELLSVGAGDGPNLTINGPEVRMDGKQVEAIGLAIHELTMNALKYGALKTSGASLDIRWTINMDDGVVPKLNLTWTERGVPAVALHPNHRGFGTELIVEALPYQLGAETSLDFRGGGVTCTIAVPLPSLGEMVPSGWKDMGP